MKFVLSMLIVCLCSLALQSIDPTRDYGCGCGKDKDKGKEQKI